MSKREDDLCSAANSWMLRGARGWDRCIAVWVGLHGKKGVMLNCSDTHSVLRPGGTLRQGMLNIGATGPGPCRCWRCPVNLPPHRGCCVHACCDPACTPQLGGPKCHCVCVLGFCMHAAGVHLPDAAGRTQGDGGQRREPPTGRCGRKPPDTLLEVIGGLLVGGWSVGCWLVGCMRHCRIFKTAGGFCWAVGWLAVGCWLLAARSTWRAVGFVSFIIVSYAT